MSAPSPKPDAAERSRTGADLPPPSFDSELSQWRLILTMVAVGLFLSFILNLFLLEQSRILKLQIKQQSEQLDQITQLKESLKTVVQDIVAFSAKHPEVRDILTRLGITVTIVPSPSTTAPAPVPASVPLSK